MAVVLFLCCIFDIVVLLNLRQICRGLSVPEMVACTMDTFILRLRVPSGLPSCQGYRKMVKMGSDGALT